MDVKVLLKPTSSFRPVVPDLEFRSNRGYPLSLPQSLIEECYATKIVIKKRPTHQKQPGLFFKTEQSYAKPFENKMVSIGPVSLHTFTSHHQNLKDHDPFSTAAKQKMKHLWNPDVILKSGFLSKNEKLHSNQVSRTCATGTLFKNQMCATKDFCQATGAQSVSVNKGLTTGSHKPRSKSRRKRKKRSSSKLSMKNKKPKDSCVAPIKKDLSSCFPLYSANMARSDQPKLDITISRVDDCENKLPQPHLSKSAHESRTSHRMNRRNTKCTSLPPAANRPTFLQAKPSSSSEKDCGDIRTDVTSVSLFETPVRSKETNSRFLNRTTSVKLPPAPGARFSCFSSMKTDAQDENEENVTHRKLFIFLVFTMSSFAVVVCKLWNNRNATSCYEDLHISFS